MCGKRLGFILAFLLSSLFAVAQQTDSLRRVDSLRYVDSLRRADSIRRDNIKIDTNFINRSRISPRRNAIPTQLPPIQLRAEFIPVTMLDYKVSYWHKSVIAGLTFNQSSFSNNWAAGGVNSFALGSNIDYRLEYNKQPFDYTTELILAYGRSKNKGQMSRKSNDRIFWDHKIATQLSKSWFFFGSVNFQSQFDKGFQYDANNKKPPLLISQFMAPGYITESLGFEYKPNAAFDLRIGTGTARQTIVLEPNVFNGQSKAYGVDSGHTFKNELAFQVVALYDKEIMPNLRLTSRYQLFIPYGRTLNNIDHRLDLTLLAKVNRLVSVTITGIAIYDEDATTTPNVPNKKIQGNENLALGIVYRFP